MQGREKALEGESPEAMLRKFVAFPEIQVIDLDAAMGRGSNDDLVRLLAGKAVTRVGGGVRTVERAKALVKQGAHRVIVGTSAFARSAERPDQRVNEPFLAALGEAIGRERIVIALDSRDGRIVGEGLAGIHGAGCRGVLRNWSLTAPVFCAPTWIKRA